MPFSAFLEGFKVRIPAFGMEYLFMTLFFASITMTPELLGTINNATKNIIALAGVGVMLACTGLVLFARRHVEGVDVQIHPALGMGFLSLLFLGIMQGVHGVTQMGFSGVAFEPGTLLSFVALFCAAFASYSLAVVLGHTFVRATLYALVTVLIFVLGTFGMSFPPEVESQERAEYHASLPGSLHVAFFAYRDSLGTMLAGSGLHTYAEAWAHHRPVTVNTTSLWNEDFERAYGLIPTLAVTGGSVLMVFYMLALAGVVKRSLDAKRYSLPRVVLILGSASLAILLSFVAYTPHLGIFVVLGVMLGLMLSFSNRVRFRKPIFARWALTFFAIFCISLGLILGTIALVRTLSLSAYSQAIALKESDAGIVTVLNVLEQSIRYEHTLVATREASALHYQEAQALLQKEVVTDSDRREAETHLHAANTYESTVFALGDVTYRAHIRAGNIVVLLGIVRGNREEIELGIERYRSAQTVAPNHPLAFFLEAQALVVLGNTDGARIALRKTLHLKPDYPNAQELIERLNAQSVP
ncbi:hypothetical protein COU18_02390 [Candidatus Kaiserbacteria bacterium CG10_big_fil_rev_8_21_14_0_10_51_14]|uniref:Uncharacterized protein n=1 Tax=Candidatus Kaiserbacteria bacterium CG10_big_fil_rev_8_21_14_0_10_51_14 TaxID=1974610 RepID=A0A2H0UBM8_9BACT|nr:MAG: hypothetical protein COU18_02390 [Candidatus Kaiserbacteria bacterium CG10_big_fil_rev_8_21_14_0_10_51_14]